ncbi:MAG: CBS domain-containing protein [Candidatus Diapherotrites archaeon]|nr:CBS domain-containing protein [Candidatus Diapherotrites archaeon]
MIASEVMTPEVFVVSPSDSVAHVKNLFIKKGINSVFVVDGSEPVGYISGAELSEAFFRAREPIDSILAGGIMRPQLVTVKPDEPVQSVAKSLLRNESKAALVFDREVYGIITKTDLLDYFVSNYRGSATVRDLMTASVKTITSQHSIFHAIRVMEEEGVGRLVVAEPEVVGIVSQRDVALSTYKDRPSKLEYKRESRGKVKRDVRYVPLTVGDVMQTEVFTIPANSDAVSAAKLMQERKVGSAVVVEDRKPIGIISKTDFVRHIAETS